MVDALILIFIIYLRILMVKNYGRLILVHAAVIATATGVAAATGISAARGVTTCR